MKKNCNVIKDLLPLYLDNVCSDDTKKIVEEHLKECDECQNYLNGLKFNIKSNKLKEVNTFQKFLKNINFKIIRNSLIITVSVLGIVFAFLIFWGNYKFNVKKPDDLKILLNVDPFNNNKWNFQFMTKQVGGNVKGVTRVIEENNEEVYYIFLSIKSTMQEYFAKGVSVPDVSYEDIDLNKKIKVYYTDNDLKEIKEMSYSDLKEVIKSSELIMTNDILQEKINCELEGKEYSLLLDYYDVSKQIIKSYGDEEFPKDLLHTVNSINGDYKSIWGLELYTDELFNKIDDFMVKNGGSCKIIK